MKRILLLLSLTVLTFGQSALAVAPSDTLKEASYALSSRNAEAQTGKYKRVDLTLAYNPNTKSFTLDITSAKAFNTYLEISDQDENVIYFKPIEIREGRNRVAFVAEDGPQGLFRLAFSEPSATKPAVFIIRDASTIEETAEGITESQATR